MARTTSAYNLEQPDDRDRFLDGPEIGCRDRCRGVASLCFEAEGTVRTTSWQYVGEGRGGYDRVHTYSYVGDGSGAFEKHDAPQQKQEAFVIRPACLLLIPAFIIVAFFVYLFVVPLDVASIPEDCDDEPGWTDSRGGTCSNYTQNSWCTLLGSSGTGWASDWGVFSDYTNHGLDATTACCGCGRGLQATTTTIE